MPGKVALLLVVLGFAAAHARATPSRKIYAAGSGLDMLSLPETVAEIMALSGKPNPRVLYLGTATYDKPEPQETQTSSFIQAGCSVSALKVAVAAPSEEEMRSAFATADIVLVSGGNTLFARDRWTKLGIDAMMKDAMANGTVLCGGSAGGIVWFDGGHSDSMEVASYKNPPGPFLNPAMTPEEMSAWAYIRVPGLSVVPGLFCPHYDVTESNRVLRSADFTSLLRRHSGECGIGVDNWGALLIDGDNFTVISREGKPGSVDAHGRFTPNNTLGRPGAWRLEIDPASGELQRSLVPLSGGKVFELMKPARYIVPSNMLGVARAQNPDDGVPPTSDDELRGTAFEGWVKRTANRFGN